MDGETVGGADVPLNETLVSCRVCSLLFRPHSFIEVISVFLFSTFTSIMLHTALGIKNVFSKNAITSLNAMCWKSSVADPISCFSSSSIDVDSIVFEYLARVAKKAETSYFSSAVDFLSTL